MPPISGFHLFSSLDSHPYPFFDPSSIPLLNPTNENSKEKSSNFSWQDDELVELLWRNGQVVMQNQNQRPPKKWPLSPLPPKVPGDGTVLPLPPDKSTNAGEAGPSAAAENQLFMQEDEMASWLHYPLDDSFDRDFCPDLLFPNPHVAGTSPVVADRRPENKSPASSSQPMMPPPPRRTESVPNKFVNFRHFSRMKVKDESQPSVSRKMCRESTVVDSSATPSVYPRASSSARALASGGETGFGGNLGSCSTYDAGTERETGTCDLTVTSSSGGSGASADPSLKPPPAGENRKRKAMECDDIEGQSEDAEYESVEDKKATRSASTRRTRAAEVHNLSERRRRDRINEKMKALQELIPRCNKTDKASMLDEAIEYLKSLQLQVQMMSMGCSMGPMMFPGVQQYMSMMGMGMGMGMSMDMPPGFSRPMLPLPPVLPSTPMPGMAATHIGPRLPVPPFHMPHVPQVDQPRPQATSHPDPAYNLVGLQSPNPLQMQNLADPYQYYLGFHHMQMPSQNQGVAQPPSTNKGTETSEFHKSG